MIPVEREALDLDAALLEYAHLVRNTVHAAYRRDAAASDSRISSDEEYKRARRHTSACVDAEVKALGRLRALLRETVQVADVGERAPEGYRRITLFVQPGAPTIFPAHEPGDHHAILLPSETGEDVACLDCIGEMFNGGDFFAACVRHAAEADEDLRRWAAEPIAQVETIANKGEKSDG